MKQILCRDCAKFLCEDSNLKYAPWLHCHHDEEKPKEKCWCEMNKFIYDYFGRHLENVNFCPICGRKL